MVGIFNKMKIIDKFKEKLEKKLKKDEKISGSEAKREFILLAVVVIVFGTLIGLYSRHLSKGTVENAIKTESSAEADTK